MFLLVVIAGILVYKVLAKQGFNMNKVPYQTELEQRLNDALKGYIKQGTEISVKPDWMGIDLYYEIGMKLSIPDKSEELKNLDIKKIFKDIARALKIDIQARPRIRNAYDKVFTFERHKPIGGHESGITIVKANFESGELSIMLEKEDYPAKDGNWKPVEQARKDIDSIIAKLPGIMEKVAKMTVADHEVEGLFERVAEKLAGVDIGLRKREFYGKEKMIKGVMGYMDDTKYAELWCKKLEQTIIGKSARAGGGIKPVIERTDSNMPGQLYKLNIEIGVECARKLDEMALKQIEEVFKVAGIEATKELAADKGKRARP